VFWNNQPVADSEALFQRLKKVAVMPQPEVHIRGDQAARYESIGRVASPASARRSPRSAS
jgi:biopolymer transport protein ExbD